MNDPCVDDLLAAGALIFLNDSLGNVSEKVGLHLWSPAGAAGAAGAVVNGTVWSKQPLVVAQQSHRSVPPIQSQRHQHQADDTFDQHPKRRHEQKCVRKMRHKTKNQIRQHSPDRQQRRTGNGGVF